MQKIYTYGQTQNVLVKLDNHTFDTDVNGERMTINAGIFVEIVPPAALQKDKANWAALHIFKVFLLSNNDLALNPHNLGVGESMVLVSQMPSETMRLMTHNFIGGFTKEGLDCLSNIPYRSTLPLIGVLKDPTDFQEQIKMCARHEDVSYNFFGKQWLAKLNSLRGLNGVPQKWLEDYISLLEEAGALPEEITPIRNFIDNYVEEEDEE